MNVARERLDALERRRRQDAEAMPGLWRAVHHRFGSRKARRVATFNRVRRQRERCPPKADQRYAPGKRPDDLMDRHQDMSERFAGLELPEAIDIGLGSERVLDGRSLAPDEIEADAHGLERQKQ